MKKLIRDLIKDAVVVGFLSTFAGSAFPAPPPSPGPIVDFELALFFAQTNCEAGPDGSFRVTHFKSYGREYDIEIGQNCAAARSTVGGQLKDCHAVDTSAINPAISFVCILPPNSVRGDPKKVEVVKKSPSVLLRCEWNTDGDLKVTHYSEFGRTLNIIAGDDCMQARAKIGGGFKECPPLSTSVSNPAITFACYFPPNHDSDPTN